MRRTPSLSRSRRLAPLCAVALGALALKICVIHARPARPVSVARCGEVRTDVSVDADLVAEKEPCLVIKADGITIEGNGHKLTTGGEWAITVMDHSHVTLRNIASDQGLLIYGGRASHNHIENCRFGSVGIFMGDDNTVRRCTLGALSVVGLYGDPALRATLIGNKIVGGPKQRVVVDVMGNDRHPCPRTEHRILDNQITSAITDNRNDEPIAFYLRFATHNVLRGNTIRATGIAHGLRLRDQADHNIIEENTVWVNNTPRAALHITSGNVDKTLPKGNLFRRNTFRADAGRSLWIQAMGDDNAFSYNIFWANSSEGARIAARARTHFNHNSFYNAGKGALLVLQDLGPPGCTFTNNIFATEGGDLFRFDHEPDFRGYRADYNLFFCRGEALRFAGRASSLSEWRTLTSQDQHSREGDPLFVNASSGDLRLREGSAAVGAAEEGRDAGALPLHQNGRHPTENAR